MKAAENIKKEIDFKIEAVDENKMAFLEKENHQLKTKLSNKIRAGPSEFI